MKHSSQSLRQLLARATLMLLTMTLLTGCEYKDLCYDHDHSDKVYVTFDWRKAPHHTATSMTVLFYNIDNPSQQPIRYDYPLSGGTATRVNSSLTHPHIGSGSRITCSCSAPVACGIAPRVSCEPSSMEDCRV